MLQLTTAPLPALRRTDEATFEVTFGPEWSTWGGAQGGALMAAQVEAARQLTGEHIVRSVSTAFLRPVDGRPLVLQADVLHQGKGSSALAVTARQAGVTAVAAQVVATAPSASSLRLPTAQAPPDVPGPERCPPFTAAEALFAFPRLVDIRPAAGGLPLGGGEEARLTAWVRLRAADHVTSGVALVLADALAPSAYARLRAPAVMPTVELTAHLLRDLDRAPQRGWLLVDQRNVVTGDGISVDEADLWTEDGDLIAQVRQVRRARHPEGGA